MEITELENIATRARLKILEMAYKAGGGHIGGSFSVVDILVALYGGFLRPGDKVIFSKGHSCLALYAVLNAFGLMPDSHLNAYCTNGGVLGGHPKYDPVHGIELSTGSLGHGLSVAVGMAWAAKKRGDDTRYFCILGDGECNEGSVWEAFNAAVQFKLGNLMVIIDNNQFESLDTTKNIMNVEPMDARLEQFNFNIVRAPGNYISDLLFWLGEVAFFAHNYPIVVVADTVKGKGVFFMENSTQWHYRAPTAEEYAIAKIELELQLSK